MRYYFFNKKHIKNVNFQTIFDITKNETREQNFPDQLWIKIFIKKNRWEKVQIEGDFKSRAIGKETYLV